jgi:RHS repeat-associated protein
VSYTYGEKPHAVTAYGSTSYTYDANGNMESGDGRIIAWDTENRPTEIAKDNVTTTLVYDGDGARIKKQVDNGTLTTLTTYVNQYYEVTVTEENGQVRDTEEISNYYLGGRLIAIKKGDELNYVHQDHLGSTTGTSNVDGTLTSQIAYFSFGSNRYSTGTQPTDKLFTGQRLDDNTGLYYYNARYYDPVIGRFISPDTIVPNPANPQSLNRYSYCLNNPLKYVDPSGNDYEELESSPPPDYQDYIKAVINGIESSNYTVWENDGGTNAVWRGAWDGATCIDIPNRQHCDSYIKGWVWGRGILISAMFEGVRLILDDILPARDIRPVTVNRGATLPEGASKSFVGKTERVIINENEVLYGIRSPNSGSTWWTRTKPQGILQWRMDQAVLSEWNNGPFTLEQLTVAKGQNLIGFEGIAYKQGSYLGGGNQIYIPNVPEGWITKTTWP